MNSRIWHAICLLFLLSQLKQLLEDRNEITFYVVEEGDILFDSAIANWSLCTSFDEIKRNHRTNEVESKLEKVNVRSFLNHSITSIERRLNLKLFDLEQSYLFNAHTCFRVEKRELETKLREFIRVYEVVLFVFSFSKNPYFYEYIHLKQASNNYDSILLRVHRRKIYDRNYLRKPEECLRYKDQLDLNRFICLNKCMKGIEQLPKNYYYPGDQGELDLSLIIDDGGRRQIHRPVRTGGGAAIYEKNLDDNLAASEDIIKGDYEKYDRCFKECPLDECFWETYAAVKIRHFYYEKFLNDSKTEHIKMDTTIYQAFYSMNDFEFAVQLFGLITLFTSTSLVGTLPTFLKRLLKRLLRKVCPKPVTYNCNRYYKLIAPKISVAIILFGIAFLAEQSTRMLREFHFQTAYPNRTSVMNFSSELRPVDLILCFPIELIIHNDSVVEEGRNLAILQDRTFGQLKNETSDGFKIGVRSLTLKIGSKHRRFNYTVSPQALFKPTTFNGSLNVLSRCFRVKLSIELMKFRNIAPITNLIVYFRNKYWEVFLQESYLNFSSDLSGFKGEYRIQLSFYEHSASSKKSNCVDYDERRISKSNGYFKNFSSVITNSSLDQLELKCDKRKACLDQCYNRVYLEKHQSLPRSTFLDEKQFSGGSIENLQFNFDPEDDTDAEIWRLCLDEFQDVDCKRVVYQESFKTTFSYDDWKISINLNFDKYTAKDAETSLVKVILNVLNLESLVFGTTGTSLLLAFFALLKRIFGLRWHNGYRFVVLSICLLAFIVHNYFIFRYIIGGRLKATGFFHKLSAFTIPNTIFCFNYTENIDEHHLLTSHYLDQVTSDLVYESVFDKVVYYNKSHVNTFRPSSNRSSNSELKFTYWYYLQMKCFELQMFFKLEEKNFIFTSGKNVITIYLNKTFANERQRVYFLYRYADSLQFSGLFGYKIGNLSTRPLDYRKYDIVFEWFQVRGKV